MNQCMCTGVCACVCACVSVYWVVTENVFLNVEQKFASH